jgi:ketosteroid isomerase-like protein
MKRTALMAAVLLAVGAVTAHADDAAVRKALQANYDKISAAFKAADPSVMDSMLAPDATLTTPDGKTWDRAKIISDMGRQSKMMKDARWNRTVTSVEVHKNEAVATVHGTFHGQFNGRDGKPHIFDLKSLTIDTWIKSGSAWKLKHAGTKELNPTMDGKPLPPGMGGGHGG